MKHYDGNTGIAVLSVPKEQVDTDTMNAISVAKLGEFIDDDAGEPWSLRWEVRSNELLDPHGQHHIYQ